MNRKIRVSLSAFIVFSTLALVVLVVIHYNTREFTQADFKEDEKVQVRIDKIRYSGTRDGRVEWELEADTASRSKEEDLTVFENVKLTFYSRDGSPYVLTAREGLLQEAAGVIEVSGDVLVRSLEQGYSLRTTRLNYSVGAKEITTAERVYMTSGGIDIEGSGMLVLVDTGEVRLHEKVKAVFRDSAA